MQEVYCKNENNQSLLSIASQNGQIDMVQLLIDKGIDINASDKEGNTALHMAAINGHKDIAQLLVAEGADINSRNKDGHTPLFASIKFRQKNIAEFLLNEGAKIDISTNYGNSPLVAAISNDMIEIAEMLISKGANLNTQNVDGHTPLHIAYNDTKMIKLLLSAGAKYDIKDNYGNSALHYVSNDIISNKLNDVLSEADIKKIIEEKSKLNQTVSSTNRLYDFKTIGYITGGVIGTTGAALLINNIPYLKELSLIATTASAVGMTAISILGGGYIGSVIENSRFSKTVTNSQTMQQTMDAKVMQQSTEKDNHISKASLGQIAPSNVHNKSLIDRNLHNRSPL
jgi:hypothetical protein